MRKEDFKRLGLHTRAQRQRWLRMKRENAIALAPIRKRIARIIIGI